jgi:hypothetical protein
MPNAFEDYVWDGAAWDGGDAIDLATASVEEMCIDCEAVWEITLDGGEVEVC